MDNVQWEPRQVIDGPPWGSETERCGRWYLNGPWGNTLWFPTEGEGGTPVKGTI